MLHRHRPRPATGQHDRRRRIVGLRQDHAAAAHRRVRDTRCRNDHHRRPAGGEPESAVAPHRRGVGYVAQDGALFPHLTVGQNIAYGLRAVPPAREVRARVGELLETVSLDAVIRVAPPASAVRRSTAARRAGRALARQPVLMLLDEPFSALGHRAARIDPQGGRRSAHRRGRDNAAW